MNTKIIEIFENLFKNPALKGHQIYCIDENGQYFLLQSVKMGAPYEINFNIIKIDLKINGDCCDCGL